MKIICIRISFALIIESNKFLVPIPLYFKVSNKVNKSVIVLKSIYFTWCQFKNIL